MKISTKIRYGLRILIQLAKTQEEGKYLKGREIAEKQDITIKYLEQITHILKKAKLIKTHKGHKGGYALALPAENITIFDVMNTFESQSSLVHCIKDYKNCERFVDCPATKVWQELNDAIKNKTNSITLKSLIK